MNIAVNHDVMRNENLKTVLRCIIENAPITKRDVKKITGLSWGSVSMISNELVKNRIIAEKKLNAGHIGRAPLVLDACTDNNLIIGLNFNVDSITVILMDLQYRILFSLKNKLLKKDKESSIIDEAYELIDLIYEKFDVDREKIIGIGIAMQGVVDSVNGISLYNPHFPQWNNVPLKSLFENRYSLPVFVDQMANCRALSERWLGTARGANNLLFIGISMGIGMSIIINGEVYNGFNGNAGELGHITMIPNGKRCSCGNYGCLETVASVRSILERAIEGINAGEKTILHELLGNRPLQDIDMSLMYRAFNMGDEFCIRILDDMAVYLGIAISNMINVFNPEVIIIGGELAQYENMFIKKLRETLGNRAWKYSSNDLLISKLTGNTAAMGAGLIIIQKIFNGDLNLLVK